MALILRSSGTPLTNNQIDENFTYLRDNAGLTGDVVSTGNATIVNKINGVVLSGLATGILRNTTTTGAPVIAIASDFPTLNQSTTGSAATLTTARNINGVAFNGSQDISIATTSANPLTIGSGLTGTSFNGSIAVTIAIDSTVALKANTTYIGTTSVALNRGSANLALTGITAVTLQGSTSGSVQLIPIAAVGTGTILTIPATTGTIVTTGDSATVSNAMLAGSIANGKLTNSSLTVGTTVISLGGSSTTLAGLTSVTSTGFTGALSGNATTATTLATARNINGVAFDGSQDITIETSPGSITGLGTGVGTFLSTPNSANLASAVTDETGTGVVVFNTSPAISTSLTTASTSFALLNTAATTVNFAGAATTLTMGASTGTSTVNNDLVVSGKITLSNATSNYITTGSDVNTFIHSRNSSTSPTGAVNLYTGNSTVASGYAGSIAIYPGSGTTADGANLYLYGGDVTAATSTGGRVSIRGGSALTTVTTAGTGGDVNIVGGYAYAPSGIKFGGSVWIDGGLPFAAGTNTAGNVYIGTGNSGFNSSTTGTLSINIGTSTNTTTINGTVKLPNVGTSGFVKLGAGGQLSAFTDSTGTGVVVFNTSPAISTSLTTASTSFALLNTAATTVNFAGAATTLTMGASTGTSTVNNDLVVSGNLTVNGTTTTINTATLSVDDKNLELGSVPSATISATGTVGTITGTGPWAAIVTGMTTTIGLIVGSSLSATVGTGSLGGSGSYIVTSIDSKTQVSYSATGGTTPTAGTITTITTTGYNDITANGAGITVKGITDKTLNWVSTNTAWTSSENLDIASTKTYKISGTNVLSSTTLGSGVTASSLTSVGTLVNPAYSGTFTGGTGIINIGSGQIYKDASGNVGVGTDAPSAQLTVVGVGQLVANLTDAGSKLGTIYAYSPNQSTGDGGALLLGAHSSVGLTTPQWAIKSYLTSGGGAGVGDLVFSGRAATADTSLTEAMRIQYTGRVGLGVSSPQAKFDIAYDSNTLSALKISGAWTNTARNAIEITNTDTAITNVANIALTSGAVASGIIGVAGTEYTVVSAIAGKTGISSVTGNGAFIAATNNPIFFYTGNTVEALQINNTQDVSIPAGQLTITNANNTATGGGQLYLNGATGNRIDFNTAGVAPPAFTTRSLGTKIVLYPGITAAAVDFALGIENSTLWTSVPTTTSGFKWYGGTTVAATLSGAGEFKPIKRLAGCYGASQLGDSLAIGDGTLLSATNGSNANTAVGSYSLSSITAGNDNTAVGQQALYSNQIGLHNVAVGSTALWNCKGSYNTAVGSGALETTVAGYYNTAMGYEASWNNYSGNYNVSVGFGSAYSSYSGAYNTALGYEAAHTNFDGNYNVSVGYHASYVNSSGVGNVAMGHQALYSAEGNKHIAIGFNAGYYINTGINNVVIGGYTGATAPISYTGSNNIVLSDGAGNVRAYYTNATSLWTIPNDMAIAGKFYKSQPAPTSLAGSNTVPITLTIANLLTYIIVATPITGTTVYNLPTGSDSDTGTSMDTNYCFDWSIMNSGGVSITLTAAVGHTIFSVGGGGRTITTGVVGNYRTRKTAANTFITYRIG